MMRTVAVFVLVIMAAHAAAPTAEQRVRIQKLETMLLAPCCYSEVVSRHGSEVAQTMRREIQAWVLAGKTDREIVNVYKQRHGERVLIEPEGAAWWWSNLVPWVMLAIGSAIVVMLIRAWMPPRPVAIAEGHPGVLPDFDDE